MRLKFFMICQACGHKDFGRLSAVSDARDFRDLCSRCGAPVHPQIEIVIPPVRQEVPNDEAAKGSDAPSERIGGGGGEAPEAPAGGEGGSGDGGVQTGDTPLGERSDREGPGPGQGDSVLGGSPGEEGQGEVAPL